MPAKITKRLSWLLLTIDIFFITIQKHFAYRLKGMTLAQS